MKTTKQIFLSLIFIFISASLLAQEPIIYPRLIGKLSVEQGIAGSGDMQLSRMENALEYRLNRYFTPSVSLAFAKSDRGVFLTTSMIQGNANLFFSPFRNNRRNDFRIGAGVSSMRVSSVIERSRIYEQGVYAYSEYDFLKESTYGFNVIMENNFRLSEHVFIGLRMSYQLYDSGDQIIGGGLNLGIGI